MLKTRCGRSAWTKSDVNARSAVLSLGTNPQRPAGPSRNTAIHAAVSSSSFACRTSCSGVDSASSASRAWMAAWTSGSSSAISALDPAPQQRMRVELGMLEVVLRRALEPLDRELGVTVARGPGAVREEHDGADRDDRKGDDRPAAKTVDVVSDWDEQPGTRPPSYRQDRDLSGDATAA